MEFAAPHKNIQYLKLREGMHVADLGAGSGHYAIEAGRIVRESGVVYAVEVQKELLRRIAESAKSEGVRNVKIVWGNAEENQGTKLGDAAVDAVILSNILFQADDKIGLLREAYRILNKEGKMLLIDWSDSHGGIGPEPQHVVTADVAQKLSAEVGFVCKEEVKVGSHHYGFIMSKS